MPTHEEHILRILGEATEPLFPSEITELLNHELRPGAAYMTTEVATRLQALERQVAQLPDGRWMLKRLLRRQSGGEGGDVAISVRAYCPGCKKMVTALPLLDNGDLKLALDSNADVRVMHIAPGGDHVWSLNDQEKGNLRNTIAKRSA